MSLMNAWLDENNGKRRWELVQSTWQHAIEGDPAALKILWDRTDPTGGNAFTINNNMPSGANEVLDALLRLRTRIPNGKDKAT